MTRDMDLIRKMLLLVEEDEYGFAPTMKIDGYTEEQIGYHAYLLVDSGPAQGGDVTPFRSTGPQYMLTSLTWDGHDFADACRNEAIWKKVRSTVKEKAGSVTFDVLKALLVSGLKHAVDLT